jgi:energy-coupling factor transporter ATP-binding protein EcfA2
LASGTTRIKVKSIEFGEEPFRKLRQIRIEVADRLTVIAGHNGIGKSTILGLLANTFGLTDESTKSYFGDPFYANIEKIVYLALEEATKAKENPSAAPVVTAQVGDLEVKKRCALTLRTKWKRARVVPRTVSKDPGDDVGQDAKIPLPAIYLGIRRLASIGEAEENDIVSRALPMDPADAELMTAIVNSVVSGSGVTGEIRHHTIKGIRKKTAQPKYGLHDALAVSMGQDSLASIATALASFNKLKRESGSDYRGGLLIIDEVDVGFHPHAIDRLIDVLTQHAKRLALQVVLTSHSPRVIEAVHPEGDGNSHAPDKVVYLLDTARPRLADDQSLEAILDDMALRIREGVPAAKRPALAAYFEDAEGAQFCEALIPSRKRTTLGQEYGVTLKLIPLGVGGSNLIALPTKDPLFKKRILVADADTTIRAAAARRGNAVKLPCPSGAAGTNRSPENIIKNFLRHLIDGTDDMATEGLLQLNTKNPSTDKVRSAFFSKGASSSDRDSSKSWWNDHAGLLKQWKVIEVWAAWHPKEVTAFLEEFEKAVAKTAIRLP